MPASYTIVLSKIKKEYFKNSNKVKQCIKEEGRIYHLFPEHVGAKVTKSSDPLGDTQEFCNIFISFRKRETVNNLVAKKWAIIHFFTTIPNKKDKNSVEKTFVKIQYGDDVSPPPTPYEMRRKTSWIKIILAERDDHRMKTLKTSREDDPSYLFRLSPSKGFCPPSKKVFSCLECKFCYKKFYGEGALRQHFAAKHEKSLGDGPKQEQHKTILCKQCPEGFATTILYLEHYKNSHEQEMMEKKEAEGRVQVNIPFPKSVRLEKGKEKNELGSEQFLTC